MSCAIPICRVCLKTSLEYIDLETPFEQHLDAVAKNDDNDHAQFEDLTYLDCFRACTCLAVDNSGNMTQNLCGDCGLELRVAYEFLRKAHSADQILREAVEKTRLEELQQKAATENHKVEVSNVGKEELELENAMNDTEEVEIFEEYADYEEILEETGSLLDVENSADEYTEPIKMADAEDVHNLECKTMDSESCASPETAQEEEEEYALMDSDEYCDDEDSVEKLMPTEAAESMDAEPSKNASKSKDNHSVYKCEICDMMLNTRRSLETHQRKMHPQSLCSICSKLLPPTTTLGEHHEEAHSNHTECTQCDYAGKEFEVFQHVSSIHHKDADEKTHLCNICSKTFVSAGTLNAHLKYHQRKEANIKSDACSICGKQFSTKHYLRLHMDVHKNERELHKCEQCDKLYVTKTALDNHMKLHNGLTLKCDLCDKLFLRQYELNVHMRFHTRNYPFACEVCGKKFAIKGHLRTHMWRHQGLKLQCEDCGKLFTSSKALQEHSFTHSEMPFPCSYCPKAYPSRQKYKVHLKSCHSLVLDAEELQKVAQHNNVARAPLLRKKLTLVQADSVMKEVEVKTKEDEEDLNEFVVELF